MSNPNKCDPKLKCCAVVLEKRDSYCLSDDCETVQQFNNKCKNSLSAFSTQDDLVPAPSFPVQCPGHTNCRLNTNYAGGGMAVLCDDGPHFYPLTDPTICTCDPAPNANCSAASKDK